MSDPLKYEVKPVGGPGSPGVLFVEGQQFNVNRFYAPPAPNRHSLARATSSPPIHTGMPGDRSSHRRITDQHTDHRGSGVRRPW